MFTITIIIINIIIIRNILILSFGFKYIIIIISYS